MSDDENKQRATIAVANSILGQITLADVLKLVHGNVLSQAREHVDELPTEDFDKLLSSIDEITDAAESEEPHAPATKQAVTQQE